MDQDYRPTYRRPLSVVRPRRTHPVFNAVIWGLSTLLGYGVLIAPAHGPGIGTVAEGEPRVVAASLSFLGTDRVITGAVALFTSDVFSGPNRAEKRNRARPSIDPVVFAQGFEASRLQLAALRNPAKTETSPRTLPAGLEVVAPVEAEPPISVAALDPPIDSEALQAIDSIAPGPAGPVPLVQSQKVAYARANTPVTDFTVVRDENGKIVSDKDLWCMASAIYFESRGEVYRGQVAVGQVVMNRLRHRLYPKTICAVVFQNQKRRNACQFSFACDGIPERVTDAKAWKQAEEIARGVVQGVLYVPEVGKATHYHATYVYPDWAPRMKKVTKIGLHVFYQFKAGWRFG